MTEGEFTAQWSELHGGASISGVVKGWLWLSFRIAKVLHTLHISPHLLTGMGVIAGILTIPTAQTPWAMALLALSLLGDGLDGSLAIFGKQTSVRGALIDSVSDRVTEFAWLVAFIRIGGPLALVGGAWAIANAQEYLRARAGGLGVREIGVVTIAERPVRASLFLIGLVAYQWDLHWISAIAGIWLALQLISLVQVARASYRRLSLG